MADDMPDAEDETVAFRRKAERYGAGYAVFGDALRGRGVDRAVLVAKAVIAVIALYAVGSAVVAGFSG